MRWVPFAATSALAIGLLVGPGFPSRAATSPSAITVEVPPRVLGINFWVPGTYPATAFHVTLNGAAAAFRVLYGSELAVGDGMPFAPGVYDLAGTLALPTAPSAVFPATAAYAVRPDPKDGWSVPALRSHESWALAAVNAFRVADGMLPVTWSPSLELAAERQAAYLRHDRNAPPDGEEVGGTPAYTAPTPAVRAEMSGYLATPVTEADLRGTALGALAAVAELAHGVTGRFFLLGSSLARLGLAADGGAVAVADGGNHEPLSPAAGIQSDPPANAAGVPTAWDDREVPSPWPGSPAPNGYPITLGLPGWNVTGPFSVALIGPAGNPIAGKVVTAVGPGRVAFIPAHPLLPGRRYRILAAVSGENPITATTRSFAASRAFTTVPSGLHLTRVGGGPSARIGRDVLVQLTAEGQHGNPVQVQKPVHWSVAGPAVLAVGQPTVSPSGMADALVEVRGTGPIHVRATVEDRTAGLDLSGIGNLAAVPAPIGGGGRVGAAAAIAEATGAPAQTAVILVNGTGATRDAIALSPWLGALKAPLLLAAGPDRLGAATRSALAALAIHRVYLIGAGSALAARLPAGMAVAGSYRPSGPIALSTWVAAQLRSMGDAYRAAIVAPNEVRFEAAVVPLAAVAARARVPVLFTSPSNLLASGEAAALAGVDETFVVGSPGAPLPAVPNPMALAAANRFGEDVLIDHEFFPLSPHRIVLVSGATSTLFAAAASALLAARLHAPMVYAGGGPVLPAAVSTYVSEFSGGAALTLIGAVSPADASQVEGAMP